MEKSGILVEPAVVSYAAEELGFAAVCSTIAPSTT